MELAGSLLHEKISNQPANSANEYYFLAILYGLTLMIMVIGTPQEIYPLKVTVSL